MASIYLRNLSSEDYKNLSKKLHNLQKGKTHDGVQVLTEGIDYVKMVQD